MTGGGHLLHFYHILKNYNVSSMKNIFLPIDIDSKDARNNNLDIMMIIKKDIEL